MAFEHMAWVRSETYNEKRGIGELVGAATFEYTTELAVHY
jgi:hypothetical protein